MRRKDTEFRIKNNNLKAPNENDIICFFRDIWFNTLTYQSVIKAFKTTGITIKMDGSENNLIKLPEIILEEFENPDSFIKDNNSSIGNNNNEFKQNSLNSYIDENMKIDDYFH